MTRSSPRHHTEPECHVLNFFCDNDDGCALTVLVRGYRFHIIADAQQLIPKSSEHKSISDQYRHLVYTFREAVKKESDPEGYTEKIKNKKTDEGNPGPSSSGSSFGSAADSAIGKDIDAGHESADEDNDSAVDVEDVKSETGNAHGDAGLSGDEVGDPEKALQNWMLAPFVEIFDGLDQPSSTTDKQSLEEWYSGPTYFYNLEVRGGQLKAIELESQQDLVKRIEELIPHIHVPKYITNMDVPWFKPRDLVVVSESDEPDPYHPCRVDVGGDIFFLKLVDTTQPEPVKREIKILNELETKGLGRQIKVPRLAGFVAHGDSRTEIMAFLLTDIADPTPLTRMLDSDVIEEKREKWAMEAERAVKLLHQNNIIWGDAKADNFMVDKHGELWIIDFGGSYTEGWVDPDLMETKEGDIMGIEKIVSALEDPEANTYDPEENKDGVESASVSQKRTITEVDEEQEKEDVSRKRKKV